jgi:alpha-galactosidase
MLPHPNQPPKIVVIGAGSAIFGTGNMATLLRSPKLKGAHLALCDINALTLETMQRLAERMNTEWGAQMTISASTDRRQLLAGADYVMVCIQVGPREVVWRQDWEIPLRHGIRQPYAENSGPGGFAHTCRNAPEMLAIARDMEELCPAAWMINFTNPLSRLGMVIDRYSSINCVGLCHQYLWSYAIVAAVMADEWGLNVPNGDHFHVHTDAENIPPLMQMIRSGADRVHIHTAGINHFAWMQSITDRHTGEDLYPRFRDRYLHQFRKDFEPMTRELFAIFGLCPTAGDTHMVEYLAWTHDPQTKPWEKYDLKLQSWTGNIERRRNVRARAERLAAGLEDLEPLRHVPSEGGVEIIEARQGNTNDVMMAVNIPNRGCLPGLPDWAIVEVPAIVNRTGVRGVSVPALPRAVTEICRREVELASVVIDAAVSGDRDLALQALLLDPMMNDIDRARAVLDDFIVSFAEWLPQFAATGNMGVVRV